MPTKPLSAASAAGTLSLRVLVLFLVAFAAGLYEVVGLPHAPNPPLQLPDPASLEALLRSSRPPLDGAIYMVGMLGWTIWAWLVLSLLLQLGVVVGERVAAGTAVVRRASSLADLLSAPLVRKAVRTSLAGGMMARVALAGVPAAAAASVEQPALVVSFDTRADAQMPYGAHFHATSEDRATDIPLGSIVYTVQAGDNLAKIADRFYADGDRWHVLYEANQGRRMADGLTFDRAGVIRPGWELIVPEPTAAIETDAEGQRWYTVRKGDSLAAISARLLGNEQRWPELYAANEGVRLDDRHVLQDPRLIWPGLVLRVPELDVQPFPAPQAPPEPDASQPVPSPPTQVVPETPAVVVEPTAPSAPPTASSALPTPAPAPQDASAAATGDVSSGPAAPDVMEDAPVGTPQPTAVQQVPERLVPPAVGGAAGAAAAMAVVAGTALVLRRRHPRPGRTQPESDVAVNAGYAEAEPTEEFSKNGEGDDLNTAAAIAVRMSREVAAVLLRQGPDEVGMPVMGATLAAVRHGRSSTTLLLQGVPMATRQQFIECLPEAATRAFGARSDVEGMVSCDGDVLVRLTGVANEASAASVDGSSGRPEAWPAPSMLLRMGLLADRQVFAANWDALGHVLVAAPSGHGADAVLEALLASLVAHRSPAELGLLVIGRPHSLPDELLGLSHVLEQPIDPHDERAGLEVIQLVRQELDGRMANGQTGQPDIVVVLPELADLSAEHQAALGAVALHGPRYRVRLLAASGRRAADLVRDCPLLPEFGTRLVLRAADEEESIALLGSGDATELGSGGHLLVRVEGRVPLQALGYRVAPDRLARLATLIEERATPVDWWVSHRPEHEPPQRSGAGAETSDEESRSDEPGLEEPPEEQPAISVQRTEEAGGENTATVESRDEQEMDEAVGPGVIECERPLELQTEADQSDEGGATGDDSVHDVQQEEPASSPLSADHRVNGTAGLAKPCHKLQARFLGARELLYNGHVVWPVAGAPDEKSMELLVFLGVEDPAGVRADLLSDSLWEEDDEDDEDRSYRLRKRRYRLRRALKRLIPGWQGDPIARMDKQTPIYRLDPNVIETDVHCFLKLLDDAKSLPREEAIHAYEQALALYRGDLLDRPDVPSYRWLDDGPRVVDLQVKYATMHQQARRRLADLLAAGRTDQELARAEELYISLVATDALDHRLWEALARLHGARKDLLGLEATLRRLRRALVELGEGDDPDRVPIPPTLKRVFDEVRASLLAGRD